MIALKLVVGVAGFLFGTWLMGMAHAYIHP